MSDNKQKTDELNWAEFQKQYFDALKFFNTSNPFTKSNNPFKTVNPFTEFNNPFMGANPAATPFMNNPDVMQQWWKSLNMNASQNVDNGNVFEKMLEQGRFYHFMAEQFSNLFEGLSNFKGNDDGINDFINSKFKNLQDLFSNAPDNMSWSGFIDPFEKPFQTMKDSVSNNMFGFTNIFENVPPVARIWPTS